MARLIGENDNPIYRAELKILYIFSPWYDNILLSIIIWVVPLN